MNPKNLFDTLLTTLPSARLISVSIGANWTAVVVDINGETRCGLAASMNDAAKSETKLPDPLDAGNLNDLAANDLAKLVYSTRPSEVSIGMAAINALLPRLQSRWADINADEVIAGKGLEKNVALVGHFPFVPRLRSRVGKLWVLEQEPHGDDLPAEAAPEIIPQADVLAITAMTLLNGTFESLLALRRPGTFTLLIGPTAPLSPVLFDYGVNIISGAVVDDIDSTLLGVKQGLNFRQLHPLGVRLVSMANE